MVPELLRGTSGVIDGVILKPLKRIPDERGVILHMLREDDPEFERFGEIYFALVYPAVVKGWHLHTECTLNYAVVAGMAKIVLYDDRPHSPTRGKLDEFFLGSMNYALLKVPPLIWNGFKGVGTEPAIIANCATVAHRQDEIQRMDPHRGTIPYDWSRRDG